MKYQEEEISELFFVPYKDFEKMIEDRQPDLLRHDEELAKLPELIGKAYSIYSDDDHIVPFDILKKYPTIIGAKDCFISGIGHMGKKSGLEELPEVVDIVNNI